MIKLTDGQTRAGTHCFWQDSDSVRTTVLTVTLSKKKEPRFARVFDAARGKNPRLGWTIYQKIENDLETRQSNKCG